MSQEHFALIIIRERLWRNTYLKEFANSVIEKGYVDRELTSLRHIGDPKADKKRDKEWNRLLEEAKVMAGWQSGLMRRS